jgi:hypothetical protein
MGCFGPDNRQVLTGSADGNVVVWDVRTGRALSDPFRLQGNTVSAAFSPDGKHILIAANRDRKVEIHSWMDVVESPPDWLLDLAEAVGGYHLNEQSVAEYQENAAQQIQRLRQTIAAADETSSLTRWGKWYLADRGTRSIGVDSTVKVPDYATHLTQGTELAALEEAISLNPTNGMAYAKLSTLLEPIEPETASLYREIAAQFGSSRALAAQVAKSPQPAKKPPISDDATIFDARDGSALLHQTGKVVRVKGEILVFGTSRTATFHYLNFAENYQTALTLAFRIADNPSEFRPELLRGYLNKTVVVEGELSQHLGVPQILMKSLAQIKVMEVPAPRSSADSP